MQKRRRKNNLNNAFMKRFIALFVAVVMVLGIAIPNALEVQAVSTRVADTDTSESYLDERFLGDPYSTEFAGRVWTDKSVNTLDSGDGDFQVTYSALATAQSVTGQTMAPLDVVLIIDISGSMVNSQSGMRDPDTNQIYSRMKFTVDAVNAALQDIMDMNEHTRVAVVAFSNSAEVLLPLDHYSPIVEESEDEEDTVYPYFSLSRTTPLGQNANQFDYPILTTRAVNSAGTNVVDTTRVYGGTNIQQGIYTGASVLTAADNETTAVVNGVEIPRVPAVVLLSDGAPTYSSASDDWWAPDPADGLLSDGATSNSYYYGNGMKAMMVAAYMKQAINTKYEVTDADSDYAATFHTIGMGLAQLSGDASDLASITLNPAASWTSDDTIPANIRSKWSQYIAEGNESITVTVNSGSRGTDRLYHPDSNDIDSINDWVDQYHAADSAEEIADVFTDIVNDLAISTPEVPTEVKEGTTLETSGYITYTDPIGHYMDVKSIETLTYDGVDYTNPTVSTDQTGTVTYTFTADVTGSDGNASNLNKILITLDTDSDGHQTLKVMIPANLIPLRVNTVTLDKDGVVQTHTHNNKQPFRLVYNVGLRDDVYDRAAGTILLDPSGEYFTTDEQKAAYQTYLEDNKDQNDGTVKFYSNLYTGNTIDGKTVGNATVVFEPSHTNGFYYILEDMPIFADKEMTIPVTTTELDPEAYYYYEEIYYHNDETVVKAVERTGAQLMRTELAVVNGQAVRVPGSPRLNKILLFEGTKTDETNKTNTAKEFYEPTFEYDTDPHDGRFVIYLGNNGALTVKTTGTLEISKEVTAADGLTVPADKEFTFIVDLEDADGDALTGDYEYSLVDADGNAVTDADGQPITGTISDGGTITLKDGQTAQIINLPPDAGYTVTETKSDGFSTKINGTDIAADADLEAAGTIVAGEITEAAFVNHYSTTTVTVEPDDTELGFSGKKVLSGRDWNDSDSYTFILESNNLTTPMPEGSIQIQQSHMLKEVTVTKDNVDGAFDFGSITYDKPGTFVYTIAERVPAVGLPNISYSGAIYQVTVTVTDNGDGTLSAATEMTQLRDDNGIIISNGAGTADTDKVAEFTNTFAADQVNWTPVGTKDYVDHSGTNPLTNGMFEFLISVHPDSPDNTPLPQDVVETNVGTQIPYDSIVFTQDHVDANEKTTYSYNFTEVIPEGATDNGDGTWSLNGMTYDGSTQRVDVTVYYNADMEIIVEPVYYTEIDGVRYNRVVFFNEYKSEEVTIGEGTYAPLNGIKTLTGRDMLEGETFEFTLDAANEVTRTALANGTIILKDKEVQALPISTTVSGGADGAAEAFDFGKITFTKPGTYRFQIKETPGNAGGVTYDRHTCYVTVVVTDTKDAEGNFLGKLTAEVTYYNGQSAADNTKAVFANTYKATFNNDTAVNLYGEKTLIGRDMKAGEFFFRIEPQNGAPMGESSPSAANTADGAITLLKNVTYTEAGEYVYLIRENIPADEQKLGGITYDVDYAGNEVDTVYRVTVKVEDKLDGNLEASIAKVEVSQDNGANYVLAADGAVVFNNKYTTEYGTYDTGNLNLRKTLENKTLTEGAFEFVLSVPENSGNPEGGLILPEDTTANNTETGDISFGELTFTKAGTYKVQVSEVIPDGAYDPETQTYKLNGITYDPHTVVFTFTVTDNGNGQLIVRRSGTSGSTTFENRYDTTGTLEGEEHLPVTKIFTGRTWNADDVFTFVLKASDYAAIAGIADGSIVMTGADADTPDQMTVTLAGDGDADVTTKSTWFDDIVFTKAGTYKFELSEDTHTDRIPGVTYDAALRIVTVTAVDNGSGGLTFTVNVTGGTGFTFTNTYKADETFLYGWDDLQVTKNLTGREWLEADTFTFTMAVDPTHEATVNAVNAGQVILPGGTETEVVTSTSIVMDITNKDTLSFGDIAFKTAGVFQFVVTETVAEEDKLPGVTYDETYETVIVTVEDDTVNGVLKVTDFTITDSGEADEGIVFKNTYGAEDVVLDGKTNLEIGKELTGRDWNDNDTFSFTLEAIGDETLAAVEAGNVVLTDQEGKEIEGASAAIVIDGSIADVDDIKFAAFGDIIFKEEGEYTFRISEDIPAEDDQLYNVTYDEHKIVITVNVTDNKAGNLVTAVSSTHEGSMVFTNTFEPDPIRETLEGIKRLDGRPFKDSDEFEITITAQDGAPLPAVTTVNTKDCAFAAESDTEKVVEFGPITYNETGTYVYTITETAGSIAGIDYDESSWTATVVVEYDAAEGKYVSSVTYTRNDSTEAESEFVFTNTYKADPTDEVDVFRATKTVTPEDGNTFEMEAGDFTFKIEPADQNSEFDPISAAEVSNDADGNVIFADDVVYTAPGKYIYSVYEVSDKQLPGVNYDGTLYTIEVNVTDPEHNGKLVADVTIKAVVNDKATEVDSIVFENTYNPEDAVAILSGDKSFADVTTSKDITLTEGQFTFELTAEEGTPLPDDTTAKNSASGRFVFDEIKYTKPGTYEYEIKEVVPEDGAAGVTYDKTIYKAVVVVEDVAPAEEDASEEATAVADTSEDVIIPEETVSEEDVVASEEAVAAEESVTSEETDGSAAAEEAPVVTATPVVTEAVSEQESTEDADNTAEDGYGMLKATVTYYDADGEVVDSVKFNNTYKPEAATDIKVTGTKELTGRDLKEGEFKFQLLDSDNNVVSETTNAEDGTFTLTVDEIDVAGEYTYTVCEVDTQVPGVTYDTNAYTVVIKVTDVDAQLEAEVVYYEGQEEVDDLVVKNTYKAASTEVQFGAAKNLEGRKQEAGEFEFELKDKSGQVIEIVTNDETGAVKFSKIVYDAEGTYEYTISEKQGSLANVTYDKTEYKVTVTVTDNQEGYLVAEVDYDGKALVFTNTYKAPAPTPSPSPAATATPSPTIPDDTVNTGDASGVVGFMGAAVLALGVIFLQLRYFRRRTRR